MKRIDQSAFCKIKIAVISCIGIALFTSGALGGTLNFEDPGWQLISPESDNDLVGDGAFTSSSDQLNFFAQAHGNEGRNAGCEADIPSDPADRENPDAPQCGFRSKLRSPPLRFDTSVTSPKKISLDFSLSQPGFEESAKTNRDQLIISVVGANQAKVYALRDTFDGFQDTYTEQGKDENDPLSDDRMDFDFTDALATSVFNPDGTFWLEFEISDFDSYLTVLGGQAGGITLTGSELTGISVVPEPGSATLLLFASSALVLFRRRKRASLA